MATETLLTDSQAECLRRALAITETQLDLVDVLLTKRDVQPTLENKLALLQVVATNYLAERTK